MQPMATVQRWTGVETKALRQAMRLSIRAFAAHLGIDARTVNKWEARHATITLRPHTQELMDTALQRAPEEVKIRFIQTVSSIRQEQHGNAEQLAAPAHDSPAEPARSVDSLTPPPENDGTGSLRTELTHHLYITPQIPYLGNDGIVEPSRDQSEISKSHLDDSMTQSPSWTQYDPVGDFAALLAASLARINTGKGSDELFTSLRRLVDRMKRRGLLQLFWFDRDNFPCFSIARRFGFR
jgi:transcriptional regulator with XRE-family HTH domain